MPQGEQNDISTSLKEFEQLFVQYEADFYRYALYLADSTCSADDLYQETWLRIATHFKRGKTINDFKKFLFTVATNIHRDELKKNKVRRFFLGPSLNDKDQHENISAAAQENPDNFLSDALNQSLHQLSHRQRSMFCLNHIEGFKISEIAKMMNCAEGTVKATIYKAVQKLRQNLKEFREQDDMFTH